MHRCIIFLNLWWLRALALLHLNFDQATKTVKHIISLLDVLVNFPDRVKLPMAFFLKLEDQLTFLLSEFTFSDERWNSILKSHEQALTFWLSVSFGILKQVIVHLGLVNAIVNKELHNFWDLLSLSFILECFPQDTLMLWSSKELINGHLKCLFDVVLVYLTRLVEVIGNWLPKSRD